MLRFITSLLIATAAALAAGEAAEPVKIGVLWSGKSSMADRVFAGFSQYMAQKAPEVQIEPRNALKDNAEAAKLYEEWHGSKTGIVFLRTDGAKVMIEKPPKIPCFIGACNNPSEVGVIKDANAPEGLITGCSYYIPYRTQLDTFRAIWPELKKVGLLLGAGHPSAPIEEAGTKAAAAELGIELEIKSCASKNDVAINAKALADGGAQLIVIGNQNMVFDNAPAVVGAAGKVPVMSFADKPIAAKQVLGGLSADDFFLGQKLAEAVIRVCVQKTPVAQVPVAFDPAPKLRLVSEKVKALGLTIPEAVLAKAVMVE